jgi:hypothetical protein
MNRGKFPIVWLLLFKWVALIILLGRSFKRYNTILKCLPPKNNLLIKHIVKPTNPISNHILLLLITNSHILCNIHYSSTHQGELPYGISFSGELL